MVEILVKFYVPTWSIFAGSVTIFVKMAIMLIYK